MSPGSLPRLRSVWRCGGQRFWFWAQEGSARAAVLGLKDKGAEVFILNRTPETAQKLARQAGAKAVKREALAKMAFDVVLNATPVGMAGNEAEPLLEAKDLKAKLVFDLVYNPIETPLSGWHGSRTFRSLRVSRCSCSRRTAVRNMDRQARAAGRDAPRCAPCLEAAAGSGSPEAAAKVGKGG